MDTHFDQLKRTNFIESLYDFSTPKILCWQLKVDNWQLKGQRERQGQCTFWGPWLSAYCKSAATYSVDRQRSQQCNCHLSILFN